MEDDRLAIDYEKRDGVAYITLNNPSKANILDKPTSDAISEAWIDMWEDRSIRCAILTGKGRAFSAGGDFGMIEKMIDDHKVRARIWKEARDLVYNVINCDKPVVSAIEGPAVGAGLVVGLLADISIAGRSARIIDGHTRIGVAAGDHAAIVWPLLCGLAKSKYYLMLCEPLSGEEAERIGLVSLVVDDGATYDKAIEVASRLKAGSRSALSWTKYSLNNWLRMAGPTFDSSLALEFLGFTGPDAREGVDAARAKRRAQFERPEPA